MRKNTGLPYRQCQMPKVFRKEQFRGSLQVHVAWVKKKELTSGQISSVSCPLCGVAPGERCVLNSGTPRSEPHLDRKLAAVEASVRK